MIAVGIAFAVILWVMAGMTLATYEMDVHVLRPWQRVAYGIAAFIAGLCVIVAAVLR